MVFSSVLFLFYFLPLAIILYFISPKSIRNFILFIMSLVFYAWGEPVYVLIMLFSTFFDYLNGAMIEKYDDNERKRKFFLLLSVFGNLGILFFFKYTDFFIGTFNTVFNTNVAKLNLALPIGISFYTFQTMSYTIDVYRKTAKIQKNPIDFGAYVAMFPQLIAGPIVRYSQISEELRERKESYDMFYDGILRFVCGLSKKILLANNIGFLWDSIKVIPAGELSVLMAWLGIIAFAFQIYFDFSGYSDMAIGLGKMFGFNFPENFNYPYISKSVTEFWRRWHISLGSWFREYVYIPLGGNRTSTLKNIINLITVWFLTGFWHGAGYNFILWGLYYGIILIIEKFVLKDFLEKIPSFFRHLYTLLLVLFGWVFFAFDTLSEAVSYLKAMFNFRGVIYDGMFLYNIFSYLPVLAVLIFASTPIVKKIRINRYVIMILTLGGFILSCAYTVNSSYNPFLYFRF